MIQLMIVGAAFIGMGIAALVSPKFIHRFFGIETGTADFRNEIRAVYGGFGIAVGGLLLAVIKYNELQFGVILTVMIATLGMAAGRLISLLFERPGKWPYIFLIVEITGGALLFTALPSTS